MSAFPGRTPYQEPDSCSFWRLLGFADRAIQLDSVTVFNDTNCVREQNTLEEKMRRSMPCSSGDAFAAMMESADLWDLHNPTHRRRLGRLVVRQNSIRIPCSANVASLDFLRCELRSFPRFRDRPSPQLRHPISAEISLCFIDAPARTACGHVNSRSYHRPGRNRGIFNSRKSNASKASLRFGCCMLFRAPTGGHWAPHCAHLTPPGMG